MSKRLTGLNPLAYMGVEPEMPPNMYMSPNAPTPTDVFNFNLGDFWVDTTMQELWVLVSQQRGVATWITLFGGGATTFITDAGTAVPAAGIINVNGDGLNILTSGAGNTITVRMNPDPTFNNVTIDGTLDITSFTGGVLVSNGAGDISEVTTTNHSLLIGNATGTISSLGVATNGQIPIGSTGVDPVLNTITAGSGISVTNGAGTITIAATGVPGGGLTLIQSQTASGVASLNFITGITNTYRNYFIICDNLSSATSSNSLFVQLSTNGGSSYITSGYFGVTGAVSGINIALGWGGATVLAAGESYLMNLTSGAGYVMSDGNYATYTLSTNVSSTSISGFYNTASTTVNAIRVTIDNTVTWSGHVSLYGLSM